MTRLYKYYKHCHAIFYTIVYSACSYLGITNTFAQNNAWMRDLADNTPLTEISIPGAHNAATGEGINIPFKIGVTQMLTISEQWENGIRAFDFRPAVKDSTLHIYHGKLRTKITFEQAIQILCNKLDAHPTEFAIIIVREEVESESKTESKLWRELMGECINRLGTRIANWSSSLTIGDLRGKILLVSRNIYTNNQHISIVRGWNHSHLGTMAAKIISSTNQHHPIPIRIIDHYNSTDRTRMIRKKEAVQTAINWSKSVDTLIINFLSGYTRTFLHIPGLATNRGYLQNAAEIHHYFINQSKAKRIPGIHFFDYVGVDTIKVGVRKYTPMGKKLLNKIIESNFY